MRDTRLNENESQSSAIGIGSRPSLNNALKRKIGMAKRSDGIESQQHNQVFSQPRSRQQKVASQQGEFKIQDSRRHYRGGYHETLSPDSAKVLMAEQSAETLSDFRTGVNIAKVRPIAQKGQHITKPPRPVLNSDLASRGSRMKKSDQRSNSLI